MSETNYKHLTWEEVERDCFCIYGDMVEIGYKPDYIIGLMKGGVVPARIFADYFGVRFDFYTWNVSLYNGINTKENELKIGEFNVDLRDKKVLIIDDIWDSGVTMNGVLDYLETDDDSNMQIKTATLFLREGSRERPDHYCEIAPSNDWIVFPWEKFEFDNEMRKLATKGTNE
jgi:hypoxanthine phosphoribosyltransferase